MTEDLNFLYSHPDPIVQTLLSTELLPEKMLLALSNHAFANNPKVKAITLILLADAGIKTPEEANKFAESVYLTPCHVDLQILFLAMWYSVAVLNVMPIDQMKALHAAMVGLVTNQTPAEIKAVVRFIQGRHSAYLGNFVNNFKLSSMLLDGIDSRSPLYKKLSIFKAMTFLGHGMGTFVSHILENIELSEYDKIAVYIPRLSDCALTGKFKDVPLLIEKLAAFPDNKFIQINYLAFEMSCTLISIMSQANHLSIPSPIILEKANLQRGWARSTQALIENKPEEALHWARISADEITNRIGEPIDFIEYTLVRAELAMGNAAGAKRLLLQLREKGTETFIDNFFFARAEFLLGNRDLAAAHFAKLNSLIDKYAAEKRFDFEVAMACELNASNLLQLASQAIKVTSKDLEIPIDFSTKLKGLEAIISVSPIMQEAKDSVVKYANLDFPVLITGETGTGKELFARALHETGKRTGKPFIAINCGSISDALIESEFFGHTPGAFTGAQTAYKGIFREAEDGTVFLDEIADISPQLQVALLRVLETGEIRPVGSSSLYSIKCRVVVATNQPLVELVEQEKFRKDLYYRLQRLEINIPPLQNRPEDIEKLVRYFFDSDRLYGEKVNVSADLVKALKEYNWPGNVRELRNAIQRVRILSSDKLSYNIEDFARCGCILSQPNLNLELSETDPSPSLNEGSNSFRRKKRLRELFEEHGELKVSEAAQILGVTPYTTSRYMTELVKEGAIEKIMPNASPNSHYYAKKKK